MLCAGRLLVENEFSETSDRLSTFDVDSVRPQQLTYSYPPHHRAGEGYGEEVVDVVDCATDGFHNILVKIRRGALG